MSEIGEFDIERLWNWNSRWSQNRLKMASFEFWVVAYRIRLFPRLISNIKWLGSGLPLSIIKLKFLKYNQVSTIMWEPSREFEPSPSSGLSVDILLLAVKRFESKFDLFRIKFKMITSRSAGDLFLINILNLEWLVSYMNITVFKLLYVIRTIRNWINERHVSFQKPPGTQPTYLIRNFLQFKMLLFELSTNIQVCYMLIFVIAWAGYIYILSTECYWELHKLIKLANFRVSQLANFNCEFWKSVKIISKRCCNEINNPFHSNFANADFAKK